jgi:hypothetical protein
VLVVLEVLRCDFCGGISDLKRDWECEKMRLGEAKEERYLPVNI